MKNPGLDSAETNFKVRSFDATISYEAYRELPKNPLYLILDNLRSAFNVGSIFRLCDSLRVKGLFLCGSTAYPPHVKLEKTSMGTVNYVPWKRFEETKDAVLILKKENIPVWAAETTPLAKPYTAPCYPEELGIVFGNEALGVSSAVMRLCDAFVEIPMYGFKNSINVAAACAVIGCWFVHQQKKPFIKKTAF
jgi:23S rRNA (guanosine2251-2'-O)-methyltransferase